MRENRLSGSMRGEARRSLACASQSVRFAYSTHFSVVKRRDTRVRGGDLG